MGKNRQRKRYFLKDSELISVDDDRFNQKDVVENLRLIIENTNPPYNIALIGKWGIGKSSIINLLLKKYKNDKENYIVQEINAWKYEKDSLKNVFLKQVWQGITEEKVKNSEKIKQIYSDFIKETTEKIDKKDKSKLFWPFLWQVLIIFLILMLIIVPIFIFYKNIQNTVFYNGKQEYFWWKTFLSFCKNIGTIVIIPLIVSFIGIIINQIINNRNNKVEINFPIETTEEYEDFLNEAIKNQKNKKIITVIDDLDRLSIDKIVEALDAIKAFVGFENCIFIVPFDDSILKKALDKNRTIKIDGNNQIVESELILDKLFQYKIYIPPLLNFDIKEYAVGLVKENIPDFINEYCPIAIFERVIRKVLIHKNVTTPRQVKKLINAFVNNKILIERRTNYGKIEKNLLETDEANLQIAKISVLQSDFNEFYDILFKDFNYINKIVEYHDNNTKMEDIEDELKTFFKQINSDNKEEKKYVEIKREYEPLINFLKQTEIYTTENIAPFMYLIQDDISIKTGDENNRRMIAAMESKNEKTVRKMIVEKPNIIESITYELENAEETDLFNGIITVINAFDIIPQNQKNRIAENLAEKIYSLNNNKEDINILSLNLNNLFNIKKLVHKKENVEKLIYSYIDFAKNENNIENNINSINNFLREEENLEVKTKQNLKQLIYETMEKNIDKINIFVSNIEIKNQYIFEEYFGNNILRALCKYMDTVNNFDTNIVLKFEEYFNQLINCNKIKNSMEDIKVLFKYNILLDILNRLFTDKICDDINEEISTEIVEKIVENSSKDKLNALDIIKKLNFNINKENFQNIEKYLNDNIDNKITYEIIIKLLNKTPKNIEYLRKCVNSIIENVFNEDKYDFLFKKIVVYFDKESINKIFKKLTDLSEFDYSKKYLRERQVFSYLCLEQNISYIENFVENEIIYRYQSYYSYKNYFKYTCEILMDSETYLIKEKLYECLKLIISNYTYYPEMVNLLVKSLKTEIPDDIMELLLPKLKTNLTSSSYEDVFWILRRNRRFFNQEKDNLTEYVDFLVDNIEMADNSNEVIDALEEHFKIITKIVELYNKAKEIKSINYDKLFKVIAKFLDNIKEINNVVKYINGILSNKESVDDFLKIEKEMKKYNLINIIEEDYNMIEDISNPILLRNIIEVISLKTKIIDSKKTLRFIEKALEKIDDVEYIIEVITILSKFDILYFKENRKELVDILYKCYHNTSSDAIRLALIHKVRCFKVTKMFKTRMDEAENQIFNNLVG